MGEIPDPPFDATQEAADAARLIKAGINNDDPETINVGIIRTARLARAVGLDITNPIVAKLLKLDTLPRQEDD